MLIFGVGAHVPLQVPPPPLPLHLPLDLQKIQPIIHADCVSGPCEATYLSIQETVEHSNHKALQGGARQGEGGEGAESLIRQSKYVHKVVVQ